MHKPLGPERDDDLLDALLERLEELAQLHPGETFEQLLTHDEALQKQFRQDGELAAAVAEQFAALRHVDNLFQGPASRSLPTIAGYVTHEVIGHGGAGVVYRARQISLGREVALKLMLGGRFVSSRARERFRREAETAAQLQHPHIAQVFDHGEYEGLPFLVQELVRGGSLADRLSRRPFSPGAAARLTAVLARAMHHAHSKGIVHRDLKPANVLLSESDQPKIVDFGLAKELEYESGLTRVGEAPGTPSYMAPEQIRGVQVGPQADVYGLGAILYELFAGRPPFEGTTRGELYNRVESQPPSFDAVVERRTPAELRAIALKCLEKLPRQRYDSALALAEDLERWLAGLPTKAQPLGRATRAWRWARRRPAAAGLIAVSLLAVAGLWAGLILHSLRMAEVARVADQHRRQSDERRELIQRQEIVLRQHLYAADVPQAQKALQHKNLAEARKLLARHDLSPQRPDVRSFAWYLLDAFCHSERLSLRGHAGDVFTAAYSPDGLIVATCGQDATVRLWDSETGKPLATLHAHQGEPSILVFAHNGKQLASADDRGVVRIWNLAALLAAGRKVGGVGVLHPAAPALEVEFATESEIWSLAFTPDDQAIVFGGQGFAEAHRLSDRQRLRRWDGFERDVKAIACPQTRPEVILAVSQRIYAGNLETGELEEFKDRHRNRVTVLALTHDGAQVASADTHGGVHIWDLRTRTPLEWTIPQVGRIDGLAFSPDDRLLVVAGENREVEIWNVAQQKPWLELLGHTAGVWSAEFSPDGEQLVTASADGTAQIWDAKRRYPRTLTNGAASDYTRVAFSSDGQTLAAGGSHGEIELWDWTTGKLRLEKSLQTHTDPRWGEAPHDARVSGLEFMTGGRRLASVTGHGEVEIWDVATGDRQADLLLLPGSARGLCAARTSDLLAVWSPRNCARIWQPQSGETTPFGASFQSIGEACFSADGRRLLVLDREQNHVRLLAVEDGRAEQTWLLPDEAAQCMVMSADARWALTGGTNLDRAVHIWDLSTGEECGSFVGHTSGVTSLALGPDGRTLASGGEDGSIRLWDVYSQQELLALEVELSAVSQLAFSPDGRALAVVGPRDGKGQLLVWGLKYAAPVRESLTWALRSSERRDREPVTATKPDDLQERYDANLRSWFAYSRYVALAQARLGENSDKLLVPTFVERLHDGELQGSCVWVFAGTRRTGELQSDDRGAPWTELLRGLSGPGAPACLSLAHFPTRQQESLHFSPEHVEIRWVQRDEIGAADDVFERYRRVHHWAQAHGYVGGWPTFDDTPLADDPAYGVALIKAGAGRELWFSMAGPPMD